MASTNTILALYSAAGLLELGGVAVTAIDLRAKAGELRRFVGPKSSTDEQVEDGIQWGQMSRLVAAIRAALDSGWRLPAAALLLALGIVLGTIANALSATR